MNVKVRFLASAVAPSVFVASALHADTFSSAYYDPNTNELVVTRSIAARTQITSSLCGGVLVRHWGIVASRGDATPPESALIVVRATVDRLALDPLRHSVLTLTGAIGFRLFERLGFAGIRCVTLLHGIRGRLVGRFAERQHTP